MLRSSVASVSTVPASMSLKNSAVSASLHCPMSNRLTRSAFSRDSLHSSTSASLSTMPCSTTSRAGDRSRTEGVMLNFWRCRDSGDSDAGNTGDRQCDEGVFVHGHMHRLAVIRHRQRILHRQLVILAHHVAEIHKLAIVTTR